MQSSLLENQVVKSKSNSQNATYVEPRNLFPNKETVTTIDSSKNFNSFQIFNPNGSKIVSRVNGKGMDAEDKLDLTNEFENKYSMNKDYHQDPLREPLDTHKEFVNSIEEVKEGLDQTQRQKVFKHLEVPLYNNDFTNEKNIHPGKGKTLKKISKQSQKYLSKTSSNKIGKNLGTIYKKSLGKHTKANFPRNGTTAPDQATEVPKKKHGKNQNFKTYSELIQIMQNMSKFDWIEATGINNKSQLVKILPPHAFWFLICANYFPRHAFAHKNNKEFIHREFDHLRNFTLEVPQRVSKDHIKGENIQKYDLNEFETTILSSFSKAIKYSLDAYRSNDYLKKVMSSRSINTFEIPEYTLADDEWIAETRRYIYDNFIKLQSQGFLKIGGYDTFQNLDLLSKIDLQELISLYEKEYYELSLENESKLKDLEKQIFRGLAEEEVINRLNLDPNDSLVDLRLKFHENTAFIDLLEKKKNEFKDINRKFTPETKEVSNDQGKKTMSRNYGLNNKLESVIEDSVCQVCNGEDYNDDDLIVFCSRCNISVHQKCYGIPTIPNDDWICDLCINFLEVGKYLRCPLCTRRGGALKPSVVRADTNIFETLNVSYHSFLKSYAKPELFKNLPKKLYQSQKPKEVLPSDIDLTKMNEENSKKSYLDHLYYNFHLQNFEFTEEELQHEPKPLCVWVHISCALFIPGMYFGDEANKTNVSGLERIDRQRFRHECLVCKKAGCGATINCAKENCKKAFHPECARRAKFCLEVRETENNQVKYYHCKSIILKYFYSIFCKKHTPLKLKRILESRENKIRDDLDRFFKTVEKCYVTYVNDLQQFHLFSEHTPQKDQANRLNKKKSYIKDDRAYFLKLVEKYRDKFVETPCTITLEKLNYEEYQEMYRVIDISLPRLPPKRERKLTVDDEIWTLMPYKNLSSEQKYEKYRKCLAKLRKKHEMQKEKSIAKNLQEMEQVIENLSQPIIKPDLRITLVANLNEDGIEEIMVKEDQPPEPLYCLCQQPYRGEFMLACENCETWYHPECVGIPPRNDYEDMKWVCEDCQEANKNYYAFDKGQKDKKNNKRKNNYQLEDEPNFPIKKIKG